MKYPSKIELVFTSTVLTLIFLLFGTGVLAQQSKTLTISATMMGTLAQAGRVVTIDVYITESSTASDQKALLEAFSEKGSEGLVNALEKMGSKGRIAITGVTIP